MVGGRRVGTTLIDWDQTDRLGDRRVGTTLIDWGQRDRVGGQRGCIIMQYISNQCSTVLYRYMYRSFSDLGRNKDVPQFSQIDSNGGIPFVVDPT